MAPESMELQNVEGEDKKTRKLIPEIRFGGWYKHYIAHSWRQ
jgi:hypothetical protein